MGVESRSNALPAPPWVFSDDKVRRVVAYRLALTAGVTRVPTTLDGLRELEPLYIAALKKSITPAMQLHLNLLQRCGGPIVYFTTLIYRRFRMFMPSSTLAVQYGTTGVSIRQTINRLCRIARSLFPNPEDHLPWHHTATSRDLPTLNLNRLGGSPRHGRKFDWEKAQRLRQAGFTYHAIAKRLRVSESSVWYALRQMEKHNELVQ